MGLPEKLGNDNTEVILFLVMAKNIEHDRSFIAETCQQYVVAVQWCMGLCYSILRMICTMTRTYCLSWACCVFCKAYNKVRAYIPYFVLKCPCIHHCRLLNQPMFAIATWLTWIRCPHLCSPLHKRHSSKHSTRLFETKRLLEEISYSIRTVLLGYW